MTALRFPLPVFMLVTDRRAAGGDDELVRKVAAAVEGGVNVVQLREKDLGPQELTVFARRVKDAVAGRALLLVNGAAEVAREVAADGIHLPEDAPFPASADGLVVGRSVHSVEAARRAADEGVDYVIAGPVLETESHPGRPPLGLRFISDVAAAVPVPVIAIGGITAEHVPDIMVSGAAGVAVVSAILAAEDPAASAGTVRRSFAADWTWEPSQGVDPQR